MALKTIDISRTGIRKEGKAGAAANLALISARAKAKFAKLDSNGDGSVSEAEFMAAFV